MYYLVDTISHFRICVACETSASFRTFTSTTCPCAYSSRNDDIAPWSCGSASTEEIVGVPRESGLKSSLLGFRVRKCYAF